MNRASIIVLHALLVVIALGALAVQFVLLFPVFAQELANERDVMIPPLPLVVLGVTLALCLEAVLLSTSRLLSMVRHDSIFTDRAFGWVNAIIVAGVVATAILIGYAVPIATIATGEDAPGLFAMLGGLIVVCFAFVLLMIVMRELLKRATGLRSELEEVV